MQISFPVRIIRASCLWVLLFTAHPGCADDTTGPSTTSEPYYLPSLSSIKIKSILTVGDFVPGTEPGKGYRLAGVPDGLGAFKSDANRFYLLVNHEIPYKYGAIHRHGATGAFVSRWLIDSNDLKVLSGQDLSAGPEAIHTWNRAAGKYEQGTTQWNEFCSADLARASAYFFEGKGTMDQLFLNGEEYDEREPVDPAHPDQGRAFAHIVTGDAQGQSWELPRMGRHAFENAVASPYAQDKTIVIGSDDADIKTTPKEVDATLGTPSPSQLYIYIGHKVTTGNPIERAGLTNGDLYGLRVKVNGKFVTEESNDHGLGTNESGFIGSGRFSLHDFGDVSNKSGVQLEDESIAAGLLRLQRMEDGAWDPRREFGADFYFTTTASVQGNSRLWRLHFDDILHPEAGGTIDILLSGKEGHKMLDNIAIDRQGRIFLQEDIPNDPQLARIWIFDPSTRHLTEIAKANPKFFSNNGQKEFLTQDEESSGIIDVGDILGDGWLLFTVQAHYPYPDKELVQGGQLLAMYVDPAVGVVPQGQK